MNLLEHVINTTQETAYNTSMNNTNMKLSDEFKQIVDQIINNYVEDPVQGRALEELVVTDLTENGFIDDEFQNVLYDAAGEMDFEIEEQIHDLVCAYVKDSCTI